MPDESCRTCGGELAKCTICAECRKPINLICVKCGIRTTAQVHDSCFGLGKTRQNLATRNNIFLKQALA